MRILYDSTIFGLQKHGGVSRYFTELIWRIRQRHDASVHLFKGLKGKLSRINPLLLDLKLRPGKFDIYHPTYYSRSVKKREGVKLVITVFDMIHELYFRNLKNFQKDILFKKKAIYSADHIICISHNTKQDLLKIYGTDEKRVSVIYLGSPVRQSETARGDFELPKRPFILYVGKRQAYKNFSLLAKAFSLSDRSRDFDLICFGGGEFTQEELSEFDRMKLKNATKYASGSDELLESYYKHALAFIYPSLYEGFGLPVLEAMAFGCPVIASNAASISEVSGSAAMLFDPLSADELRGCIDEMLVNAQLRRDYIGKGKIRAGEFSWDKTAEETASVYKFLLN